ncbi:MAG: xanthine dehydrogenase family protein subunit M [Bacteroidota bacterium]
MIPTSFDYHKASSLAEAIELLNDGDGEAKILAGGHSLLPVMKLRLNAPEKLIDIAKLPELQLIKEEGTDLLIGAAATHDAIAQSELVRAKAPIMAQAAGMIGDVQVRNVGTIGGSIAHADPATDWPAVILASGGSIELQGPDGSRTVTANDFFLGLFMTDLEENEIITAIRIPITQGTGHYAKFVQPASRFAIVGCAAVLERDGDICIRANIAYSGVTGRPFRDAAVENALVGQPLNEATIEAAAALMGTDVEMLGDHFASKSYRHHLAKVYTKRAILAALA